MMTFPGYEVLGLIYESDNSLVYRGLRHRDQQPVILKILKQEYPSPADIARFQQEYELLRGLDLEGVIKALDLLKYHNRPVIILEDFGGESLRKLMATRTVSLEEFLTLGIAITQILGEIHSRNIIHKDINPSNIVFNAELGQVKVIDFGISTVLSRENPTLKNPQVLEGTLAYMSPEQTGRMNRFLDYRTDFYSLGVTFYELLINQLPFETVDALEMVHCHIAKQPVPLSEIKSAKIPPIISEIVMKLMAKNAEDRYQTAWGIKADLEQCQHQLKTTGTLGKFPLGMLDVSEQFKIPQKLYGRASEIQILLSAFERVAGRDRSNPSSDDSHSSIELMLVAGYSGIGKSALVQEIYKPITQARGYFIAGKFDQFQRNIPYSAVVNAFSELVQQILTEPPEQLQQWRDKLLAALGHNGQIIIDVIPEVELIIGPQSPVAELGAAESQNRFNLVFENFIRVFCQPEHPLVIFLDDLQWVDSATLNLIELMMTDEQTQALFLMGAYRDNEVNPHHPLMMTIDELQKQGAIIHEIILQPLALENIVDLLVETLHSHQEAVQFLGELILRKTNGNPFFINEFIKTLYQEKLLIFDVDKRQWQWDIAEIEAIGITDNVVELMISKLEKLPEPTQEALQGAACVGNTFNLEILALIYEKSVSEIFQNLFPAIQSELIQSNSQLEVISNQETSQLMSLHYQFLHDRVQQAAYALMDEAQKTAVHFKIGKQLLTNFSEQERSEHIFEVIDHLNLGQELITDEGERIELAALNLLAGKKAKDATAYRAALAYLKVGKSCLPTTVWETHYELAFTLHKKLAEVEYLNGNFEASQILIDFLLSQAKSQIEQAELYNLVIVQGTMSAQYAETLVAGRNALALLGIQVPEDAALAAALNTELAAANTRLSQQPIASLVHQGEMTDLVSKSAVQLLNHLLPPAYFLNQTLWTWFVVKIVNISLEYGHVPESCYGYSFYGSVVGSGLGDYQTGYELGLLALNLSKKYNNLTQKCKACNILAAFLNHWVRHLREAELLNNEGYQAGLESGELQFSGYILIHKLAFSFHQGQPLSQVLSDIPKFLLFSQKTKNQVATDTLLAYQIPVLNLLGMTPGMTDFYIDSLHEDTLIQNCQSYQNSYSLCLYYILKTQVLYLYGCASEALNCALEAQKLLGFIPGEVAAAEHNFYYSLSLAALYPRASASLQQHYWQQLETHQNQMKIWANNCPENFQHKYLLVAAEMARLQGNNLEAIEYYNQSILSATEQEFIQNEALANELAANFWLNQGKGNYAKVHLREAHYGYQRWGANRKVEALEAQYPQWLVHATNVSATLHTRNTRNSISYTTRTESVEALDLATVMKAAQAISVEIVLDKLLSKLITLAIENAGAQKGYLILFNDNELSIAAAGEIGKSVQLLQSVPVDSHQNIPTAIIHYVARTKSDVVLADAAHEGLFASEPYVMIHKPQSILCAPILNQGKLIGILYLENNLITGAFTPNRLEVLKIISSQAAISIENALLYRTLEQKVEERTAQLAAANQEISALNELLKAENIRLSTELEITRRLQQMILPREHELQEVPGLEIAGFMEPAAEVGGDYYDVLQKNGKVKIGIGDVTGHGLESGVLMIMVQTAVRTLLGSDETDPVKFMDILNQTIYDNVQRMNSDKTLTLALLDYQEGNLQLSGQHEEVLRVYSSSNLGGLPVVERIDTMDLGFPIGLDTNIIDFLGSIQIPLNPGDGVVLYTDGITEAENIQGVQYGLERLCQVVQLNWRKSATEIQKAVIDDVRHHIGTQKVYDDITLLVMKQKA